MTVPAQRLVFCINSGRSGSQYLARLLGTARRVDAHHEPEPSMGGDFLTRAMQRGLPATRAEREVKAEAIRARLALLPADAVYAETNHMFIKTFHDVVLDAFDPATVQVVILRRRLVDVLKSFVSLGYFTDRNPAWREWMHTPEDRNAALPFIFGAGRSDAIDLSLWYLFDIEARARRFLAEGRCRTVATTAEGLREGDGVAQLFAALGLRRTWRTWLASRKPANTRRKRKEQLAIPITSDECRRRLDLFVEAYREAGVPLPLGPEART